jgi:D-beta-D-heptose 7-phosphate kinase/D-beta-D-heptose 1-phosphate adenosyltransferase
MFNARSIHNELVMVDPSRPTTVKERFVGLASTRHPSQILRVDRESTEPLPAALEERVTQGVTRTIGDCAAVLISDYAKGFCTPRVLRAAIETAGERGIPVLVDPVRLGGYDRYRGATLLKPNRREAEQAAGEKIVSPDDALRAGRRLCGELDFQMAVITLDRDGMALVPRDGEGCVYPTNARAVYDITGAGDMALAMLGLCLADGVAPDAAVRLANVAAGLEVQREGVAVIAREEIRRELQAAASQGEPKIVTRREAAELAASYRRQGRKVVFTNGCFDLLHIGHITCLAEAAAMGDVLLAAVNSDDSVRRLKGPTRPVIGQNERSAMLAALACVTHVVIFEEDTPAKLIEEIRPDVLVKGGATSPHEIAGREFVESYGGVVRVTSLVDGFSTTNILASLAERNEREDGPVILPFQRRVA